MKRNKVFISYSRKDKSYLEELSVHLDFLKKHYEIDFWSDKKIKPGALWRDEIRNALATTRVAILLVSPNFLSSEFINDEELPTLFVAAQSKGAKILPLLIRPCLVDAHPVLSNYQFANNLMTSVSKLSEAERDELYTQIAETTLSEMKKAALTSTPIKDEVAKIGLNKMELEFLKWLVLTTLMDGAKNTAEIGTLLPSYKRKAIVATIESLKLEQIVVRERRENRTYFHLSEAGNSFMVENQSRIAYLGKR